MLYSHCVYRADNVTGGVTPNLAELDRAVVPSGKGPGELALLVPTVCGYLHGEQLSRIAVAIVGWH